MNMAIKPAPPNPHQEAINNLYARVLPRVRALPFAKNTREPWLGNATVDKSVLATIETIFAIADEDAKNAQPVIETTAEDTAKLGKAGMQSSEAFDPPMVELPEMDQS